MAYFGRDNWSEIDETSEQFAFDAAAPVMNTGNLVCCTSTGDLTNENTYVESAAYLFAYIDASFTIAGVTGNTSMNADYTVRMVLADGAVTEGVRGDVLLRVDAGGASCPLSNSGGTGTFKWMDSANDTFSATRPASPITMDSSVVTWENPFGEAQGNQSIPVIYANIAEPAAGGKFTIDDATLKAVDNTYTFGFDTESLVMFPAVLTADINSISSLKNRLSKIHFPGLPFSTQTMGVGNPAATELTITPAADVVEPI